MDADHHHVAGDVAVSQKAAVERRRASQPVTEQLQDMDPRSKRQMDAGLDEASEETRQTNAISGAISRADAAAEQKAKDSLNQKMKQELADARAARELKVVA
eukprot:6855528-Prymnesium_polylepis.1